ncbi:hypothetical protein CALVIDRAFT_541950 [Calocera viscosa TUFC12733]|uniref:Uncharacterized protein n=1 Tax=Calocera viscosa (strain TUFC12733) TaxID=1330018 RepID=A0A167H7Q7_CALVF|nr:hypothetical protein CALVIDRAFT_541950 [Calocera viscosa TUFC12733]
MGNTPPVDRSIRSWEKWQLRTEHLPPVISKQLAGARGVIEFDERRAQWIEHTKTIYGWDARRAGDWEFVCGGIQVLLKEYRAAYKYDDLMSQQRAYWATCDIAELLLKYHLRNGHEAAVINVIARHIKHPDVQLQQTPTPSVPERSTELDIRDDLVWERHGDPDADLVDEIFRCRKFEVEQQDGKIVEHKLLARTTVFDEIHDNYDTAFLVSDGKGTMSFTKAELFKLYGARFIESDE